SHRPFSLGLLHLVAPGIPVFTWRAGEQFEIRPSYESLDARCRLVRLAAMLRHRRHDDLMHVLSDAHRLTFSREQTKLGVGERPITHAREKTFTAAILFDPSEGARLVGETPRLDDAESLRKHRHRDPQE